MYFNYYRGLKGYSETKIGLFKSMEDYNEVKINSSQPKENYIKGLS